MAKPIDGDLWARAKEIFSKVVDLTPAQQARELTKACGDDVDLHREVESLLEAESGAPSFLDGNAPEFAAPSLGGLIPEEGTETQPDPLLGDTVGDIQIAEVLGRGGFGRVYLGRDTKLGRDVAVKVLRSSQRAHAEAKERLRREARLLSKLDHPNICRIYGLLEEGDDDYLLLEYIDGKRLTDAAAGKDLETRLGFARQIADALTAAHAETIIHRDLKPDNVLVTPEGVVKVLDLGIARFAEDLSDAEPDHTALEAERDTEPGERDDLTRLGSKLGTIRYMSPEQALGEPATMASDIFSLGLLLHELFGESPAYRAGPDLLERVQRGSIEPLAHPDPDLVPTINSMLSRNPDLRPTAAEVRQRIESLLDRPRQRRRRLRRRGALAAIAVAVASALIGWWVLRAQSARDIQVAEELLSQAKDIEWRMRAEYLSPKHDITPARAEVEEQIAELAARIEDLGQRATGRARYALGRAALSIGDIERARQEVQGAWNGGFQTPDVAYTLGRSLARLYRDELEWMSARYTPADREEKTLALRTELAQPAARFLEMARDAEVASTEFIEGLLAAGSGDYDAALAQLSKVDSAWFYEREQLTGWIHLSKALQQTSSGSVESLLQSLSEAELAYSRSAQIGRSDPVGNLGLCRVASLWILRGRLTAEEAEQRGREAIETCEKVLELDPESVQAHYQLAEVLYSQAEVGQNQGRDVGPLLAAAEEVVQEGLALAPDSLDLHHTLVKILTRAGAHERLRGADPSATYGRARRAAERLMASDDAPKLYLNATVNMLLDNAVHLLSQGESPVPILERAISIADRLIAIDPEGVSLSNLAACYYVLALYQAGHGIDPELTIKNGVSVVTRSLESVPGQLLPLRVLGLFHGLAHYHGSRVGSDVSSALAAGRRAYGEALELDPEFVWARVGWVDLELDRAGWLIDRDQSPEEPLATVSKLLAKLPADEAIEWFRLLHAGRAADLAARWQAGLGRSPVVHYRKAEALLKRAIDLRGTESDPFTALAKMYLEWGQWALKNGGQPAVGLVRKGLEASKEALAVSADNAEAFSHRAALMHLEVSLSPASERRSLSEKAAQAQARACEINRFLPSCREG